MPFLLILHRMGHGAWDSNLHASTVYLWTHHFTRPGLSTKTTTTTTLSEAQSSPLPLSVSERQA